MSPAGHDEHGRTPPDWGSVGASEATSRVDLGNCVARVRQIRFLTPQSDDHFSLDALEDEIFSVYAITNDEGETTLQIRPTWIGRTVPEETVDRPAASDGEQSNEGNRAIGRGGDEAGG